MIKEVLEVELIKTGEGIHTLYNKNINEHYHSLFGSLQESMHIFIRNGFCKAAKNRDELNILEMGFGTGLNAILTYRENQVLEKKIFYTGIDIQPLPLSIVSKLNYFQYFGKPLQLVFEKIHKSDWFQWNQFENFNLLKIEADIIDHRFDDHYDLIYYDAFSPSHQPELWQFEILKKIYDACNRRAVLVTYCSRSEVRRTLESVGFKVEKLQGANGKKEMIRAIKN